jgi:hypothetical protein
VRAQRCARNERCLPAAGRSHHDDGVAGANADNLVFAEHQRHERLTGSLENLVDEFRRTSKSRRRLHALRVDDRQSTRQNRVFTVTVGDRVDLCDDRR